jgi:uncharacterized protein (TIRG00374 family)
MTGKNTPERTLAALDERIYRWLFALIFVSLSAYIVAALWLGWRDLQAGLLAIGLGGLASALILTLMNFSLRFLRWRMYFRVLQRPLPWRLNLRIYLAGLAFTATPGKAGEMMRSLYLRRHGVPVSESIAAFLADRLSDLLAVLLLASLAAWSDPGLRPLMLGLSLALILALGFLLSKRFMAWLQARSEASATQQGWRKGVAAALYAISHCQHLFSIGVLLPALALALLAWCCEACILFLAVHWVGAQIGLLSALSIYAVAKLIGALSFIPGGVGSTEISMLGLLLVAGVPEAEAVICTLFLRLSTFWVALLLGAAMLPRR